MVVNEPRTLGRHPHLDGLRGLAILAVLATHMSFLDMGRTRWALSGGFLGVDVFLVLSGFLIGAVLLRELDRSGSIDGRNFARRRARRLLPPLVVFLAIASVVMVYFDITVREVVLQVVLALGFVSNWQLAFGHSGPFDTVHLWSLSVEGQFYLLMAVGMILGRRHLHNPRRVVTVLVVASLAVAVWRYILWEIGTDPVSVYQRTDARADSMLLGIAAALLWRSRAVDDRPVRIAGAVGLVFLAVTMVVVDPSEPWLFAGGFTLVAVAVGAVVMAATSGHGVVATIGNWRPLRWIGAISFSLYLWHLPIYLWTVRVLGDETPLAVKAGVAIPLSILAGYLSYRIVETRVLAPWRRVSPTRSASNA